ncbi:hypothetical protein LCGC14_2549290 [marine sediment metagenome]|uniref:YjiS-like domain-containing protein n=1 Tax=marine sediment metagenome TaxID=412755 RepID=A0A0F9ANV1_9ZZZZ
MAYLTTNRTAGIFERIGGTFANAGESLERYRLYRRTLNELSALSNRELADLGVHRSAIRSIAHEAAYSKR